MVTGSVGGAARLLNVSSPGISRVMKHAEALLGLKLFSRKAGRYTPTREANDIFSQINGVYDKVEDLQFLITRLKRGADAELKIGSVPSSSNVMVPRAIGAELLKWLSSFLIGLTKEQPAFQAFGIALILLVWINYFSRVVVYAAAWAFTTVQRGVPEVEPVSAVAAVDPVPPAVRERRTTPEVPPSAWVGSGAALTLALVALLRRRKKD